MFSVKNLNWLSSKQALADLSRFVVEMQAAHNLTGKWIALGNHLLYVNRDTERTRKYYHIDMSLRIILFILNISKTVPCTSSVI